MNFRPVLRSYLQELQSKLYTTLPAIVVDNSKFESEQVVDVQPLINPRMSTGETVECPIVYNVPVVLPSAGKGLLSFPIQVGDTVMCQFSMRNLEDWLDGDGSAVDEPTSRFHSMTDGIAVVGLYTKSNHLQPDPVDVVLKFKNNKIILRDNGDVEVESASKFAVRNDSEELVALLSETLQEIADSTVNSIYGISILNNKPQILALKSRLDSFKL